ATGSRRSGTSHWRSTSRSVPATPPPPVGTYRRRSSPLRTGTTWSAPHTRRATPQSAARSRPGSGPCARTGPAAGGNPRARNRAAVPRSWLHSSRTARSPVFPPGGPKAVSRGSTTGGSELDCDPVVDAPEHPGAEREGDDRRPAEVDEVPHVRQLAPEERRTDRLERRGERGAPGGQTDHPFALQSPREPVEA